MTAPTEPRAVTRAAAPVVTAAVLALAALVLAGCGGAAGADPSAPSVPPAPAPAASGPAAPGPAASGPAAGPVDRDRAGRIATDRFGGRVLNVEPDTANGTPTWEVEVADSREGRIEVDVAQATGEIVEMERDS